MTKKVLLPRLAWKQTWDAAAIVWCTGIFLKFVLFDVLWCVDTTFASFSHLETYVTKLMAALVLAMPYLLFRLRRVQAVVLFLLDVLLIANLLYYRTYYTHIPLSSYGLIGNLADFTGSVFDSFRWADIVLPLSSVLTIVWARRCPGRPAAVRALLLPVLLPLLTAFALFGAVTAAQGGFHTAFNNVRQSAYLCSSCAPMYSVFGCMYYDLTENRQEMSAEETAEVEDWLAHKPPHRPLADSIGVRNNCIVILAESLESWVLEQEVEGQEITPCLNRLLKDSTTLYAPHVLTQVKGGRSIDAQLMVCAGMLPLNNGAYSSLYADNTYFTLQKAMREQKQARAYLLTIDKVSTWNQGAIANSFGTDTIVAYHDFEMTEAFGTHKRIGDGAFFAQCCEKIENGEVWKEGENAYLQLVTYSGHAPFKLPEHLREISFSSNIPEKAADYMTTARYTDKAIGQFIDYLKTLPRYKETLIVITGDHEGLASYRHELCNAPGGKGLVSDKPYTPFIVVNSPVGLRYGKVMGQIDIYPTLLNLLQLDSYPWSGLGQSILDPAKPGTAVGSQMNLEGETDNVQQVEWLKEAHNVSDLMLRFDYLKDWPKAD